MSALVCWSGGCDSTLVLYELGTAARAWEPVRAVSFTHPQVPAADEQRRARAAILKEMRSRGLAIQHAEVTLQHKGDFDAPGGNGSIQPVLWLSLALPYLRKEDDLYLGYVSEDNVWHYREWLYGAFANFKVFDHHEGSLRLPLEWVKKDEVHEKLRKLGLLRLCWTCEDPKKGKTCGKCGPCSRRGWGLARGRRV